MNTNTQARKPGEILRHGLVALLVLLAGAMFLLGPKAVHAAPLAGTVIGNTATATYNDAGGTARLATSNQVQTTVSQVKSFTLVANGARTAAPGQTVYYPHTITNTGNGNDAYSLGPLTSSAFAGPSLPHQNMQYFGDNAGAPDTVAITATPSIGPGQQFRFWVAGTVPVTAVNGNTATINFQASDTGGNTQPTPAPGIADTTTVAASVITVNKTLSVTQGPSPNATQIVVTLAYTNSGTAAATGVTITDPLPVGMDYVATNIATWNGAALTDAAGGDPAGIAYEYNAGSRTVTTTISSVPAGFSGNVQFRVTIAGGLAPGFLANSASYATSTQGSASTSATYEVLRSSGVVANGSTTAAPGPYTGVSTNGAAEPVTVATAAAGAAVTFTNVIWNLGNAADTFVITTNAPGAGNPFPAGTTFTLLQSDGVTPLVASTTPSVPAYSGTAPNCPAGYVVDAANQRCGYRLIVRAQLPASAAATSTAMNLTVTATSSFDGSKSDTVIDTLSAITSNFVDLTSNTARTDSTPGGTADSTNAGTTGFGATGAAVVTSNPVTPSSTGTSTTTFSIHVNNGGNINDTFNLTATSVPAGWTVTYRASTAGSCATPGAAITQVTVSTLANTLVCAVVTLPATTSGQVAPATYPIGFVATSATNPAVTDTLTNAVVVAVVRSVTLQPPNSQQTFPGGAVTYTHILSNLGNVAESISFAGGYLVNTRAGWTATAYLDNGDGVFTSGTDDVPAQALPGTGFSLNPGATRTLYVRVFAPPGATAADPANITSLTATATYLAANITATVADTTSVTDGLLLTKTQRTVNCDGTDTTPAGTFSTAPIPASVLTAPGRCIQYQIVAQNTTSGSLNLVVISDNIPGNTTHNVGGTCAAVAPGFVPTAPAHGATGTVSVNVGTMTTGSSVTLSFCVRIDP